MELRVREIHCVPVLEQLVEHLLHVRWTGHIVGQPFPKDAPPLRVFSLLNRHFVENWLHVADVHTARFEFRLCFPTNVENVQYAGHHDTALPCRKESKEALGHSFLLLVVREHMCKDREIRFVQLLEGSPQGQPASFANREALEQLFVRNHRITTMNSS